MNKTNTIREDELEPLIDGIVNFGFNETYAEMKTKIPSIIECVEDADEVLLNQSNVVLQKARSVCPFDSEEGKILYKISFLLRKLAHEIHRIYIKLGKVKKHEGFLYLMDKEKTI